MSAAGDAYSSPARPLPACWKLPVSGSAWTAKDAAWVESTTGAVAVGLGELPLTGRFRDVPVPHSRPWLRFQSPLVKPDVRVARIRLSPASSSLRARQVGAPSR